ncbi:PREDICTED: probable calcium-binding protein CML36 [Nelumbo nucifera]|uniref:Probable calcium-binding protein CML36 n=1 Tax=Nelumbo nucifera TaxID=4432 RepID=A0A1U8BAW0_NELNU|nr:PREDICTED: probable calcium-binding protein CML36 [Nelumbo nucifera]
MMKMMKLSPKHLFRSKKSTRSVSRSGSDPPSFGSGTSSSSDSLTTQLKEGGATTPRSVLHSHSHEISGDWSDLQADFHFQLVEAFKFIDRDGDGKITRRELENILSRLGADTPSEEMQMMLMELMEVDRDGDGCINLKETGATSPAFGPYDGSELRDAFDFFDAGRDGKISADELHRVFTALGDDRCTIEDCRLMIGGVDTDGDGFVCFEDFLRMMEGRMN